MTVPATTPLLDPAPAEESLTAQEPTAQDACAACPHPLSAHDPIGLRFCRATAAGTVSRGCVCRSV
jgi:hypothetical protein